MSVLETMWGHTHSLWMRTEIAAAIIRHMDPSRLTNRLIKNWNLCFTSVTSPISCHSTHIKLNSSWCLSLISPPNYQTPGIQQITHEVWDVFGLRSTRRLDELCQWSGPQTDVEEVKLLSVWPSRCWKHFRHQITVMWKISAISLFCVCACVRLCVCVCANILIQLAKWEDLCKLEPFRLVLTFWWPVRLEQVLGQSQGQGWGQGTGDGSCMSMKINTKAETHGCVCVFLPLYF